MFNSHNFNVECKDLGDNNYLHVINIEEIDDRLKKLIDSRLASIWEGDADSDLGTVKKQLKDLVQPDNGTKIKIGSIAEFFLHLYLNDVGFRQECLFKNLEEPNLPKKGFDGYYSLNNEGWIVESKSHCNNKKTKHCTTISEAYTDISDKISGTRRNNPWLNAYNHACIANSDEAMRKKIKKLSDNFINKEYCKIEDFNLIPGSTIFFDGDWECADSHVLETEIIKLISKFNFKKINVVCINKKSVSLFLDYLNK